MIEQKRGSSHYLFIDLSRKSWQVSRMKEDLQKQYLGGKGIALKLYQDHAEDLSAIDPLGEDNLICFTTSSLTATGAPCSGVFEVVSKSPLTGLMISSPCAGPFGYHCKTAGFDGLVISGQAASPMILSIDYEGVKFLDGSRLWGMTTSETRQALDLNVKQAEVVIGPAGEHLVAYADMRSGERSFGRGGMGAVMGAKRLKAITVSGLEYRNLPSDRMGFDRARTKISRQIEKNSISRHLRSYGTAFKMRFSMDESFSPVQNFQMTTDKRLEQLSGERLSQRYRQQFDSCRYCTILCGHKGAFPDNEVRHIPEYDELSMLGPNLGVYNPDIIAQWVQRLHELGIDPVSAGGVLAWAMEASQKGLFHSPLRFEQPELVTSAIEAIASREGYGDQLAQGTRWLGSSCGGQDLAMQVKGLEIDGIHPSGSPIQGLSYAVNNCGASRQDAAVAELSSLLHLIPRHPGPETVSWTIGFEHIFAVFRSCGLCRNMVYPVILESSLLTSLPKGIGRLLMRRFPSLSCRMLGLGLLPELYASVTGWDQSTSELLEAGERIVVLERWMNSQMGASAEDDILPERLAPEGSSMDGLVKEYHLQRGYDSSGVPLPSTLRRLGIIPDPEDSQIGY